MAVQCLFTKYKWALYLFCSIFMYIRYCCDVDGAPTFIYIKKFSVALNLDPDPAFGTNLDPDPRVMK